MSGHASGCSKVGSDKKTCLHLAASYHHSMFGNLLSSGHPAARLGTLRRSDEEKEAGRRSCSEGHRQNDCGWGPWALRVRKVLHFVLLCFSYVVPPYTSLAPDKVCNYAYVYNVCMYVIILHIYIYTLYVHHIEIEYMICYIRTSMQVSGELLHICGGPHPNLPGQ